MTCPNCGALVAPDALQCGECRSMLGQTSPPMPGPVIGDASGQATVATERKSRLAAGLLGIFLGGIGIHSFYLGFTGRAVLQIILTCCTCGVAGIWGFVEGIMILAGGINSDANGVPLQDSGD